MSNQKVQFVLETVSGAFGPGDEIPWDRAHYEVFDTLIEAQDTRRRDVIEMYERCGSGWDSHRRIVPTADTDITYQVICLGTIGRKGGCPDSATEDVTVFWPAGEPQPQCPIPDGWASVNQCQWCAGRESQLRAQLYAEYDREREKEE